MLVVAQKPDLWFRGRFPEFEEWQAGEGRVLLQREQEEQLGQQQWEQGVQEQQQQGQLEQQLKQGLQLDTQQQQQQHRQQGQLHEKQQQQQQQHRQQGQQHEKHQQQQQQDGLRLAQVLLQQLQQRRLQHVGEETGVDGGFSTDSRGEDVQVGVQGEQQQQEGEQQEDMGLPGLESRERNLDTEDQLRLALERLKARESLLASTGIL
jgi:hypothetical protein